jgi:hypothetical protein
MKKRLLQSLTVVFLFSLTGCGKPLGIYKFEDASLVQSLPLGDNILNEDRPYPYKEYLRIEVSSETNLNREETGAGLYIEADYCPIDNRKRIIAFGPMATDGHAFENWQRDKSLPFVTDKRDGKFRYVVYLVPASLARRDFGGPNGRLIKGYDLRAQKRAVCMRFFVPGYNIIASRSKEIMIPADAIYSALSKK